MVWLSHSCMYLVYCMIFWVVLASPTHGARTATSDRIVGQLRRLPKAKTNCHFENCDSCFVIGRAARRSNIYFTLPTSAFSDKEIRMKFIQKVYSIFALQVLATILLTGFLFKFSKILHFFRRNFQIIGAFSMLVSMLTNMALVNSSYLRHTFPMNIILLVLSTISQAIPVGIFASFFDPLTVCLGSMHTLTIFAALTVYAWQPNPRWDLSTHGQWLLVALSSIVIAFPLLQQIGLPIRDNIRAAMLAMVFGAYVVYDTQRIVGNVGPDLFESGNRYNSTVRRKKSEITPDDYILAALLLYEDILGMFIEILKFLAHTRNSKSRGDQHNDDYDSRF